MKIFVDVVSEDGQLDFVGRAPNRTNIIYLYPVDDDTVSVDGILVNRYNKKDIESYIGEELSLDGKQFLYGNTKLITKTVVSAKDINRLDKFNWLTIAGMMSGFIGLVFYIAKNI